MPTKLELKHTKQHDHQPEIDAALKATTTRRRRWRYIIVRNGFHWPFGHLHVNCNATQNKRTLIQWWQSLTFNRMPSHVCILLVRIDVWGYRRFAREPQRPVIAHMQIGHLDGELLDRAALRVPGAVLLDDARGEGARQRVDDLWITSNFLKKFGELIAGTINFLVLTRSGQLFISALLCNNDIIRLYVYTMFFQSFKSILMSHDSSRSIIEKFFVFNVYLLYSEGAWSEKPKTFIVY